MAAYNGRLSPDSRATIGRLTGKCWFGVGEMSITCWSEIAHSKDTHLHTMEDKLAAGAFGRAVNYGWDRQDVAQECTVFYCLTGQHRKMWLNAIKSKRNPLPLKSLSNPMLTTTDRWLRVVLYSCKVYEWNKTSKTNSFMRMNQKRNAWVNFQSFNRVYILVTLQRTVPLGMFKNWSCLRCFQMFLQLCLNLVCTNENWFANSKGICSSNKK